MREKKKQVKLKLGQDKKKMPEKSVQAFELLPRTSIYEEKHSRTHISVNTTVDIIRKVLRSCQAHRGRYVFQNSNFCLRA